MLYAFLLGAALAAEPPPAPAPSPAVDGQCAAAMPIHAGETATCSGVLIPTSIAADLVAMERHAGHLAERYRLDTGELESQVAGLEAQVTQLQLPAPWWERQATQRWVGRAEGLIAGASLGVLAYAWLTLEAD